ncbi:MAG: peptidoglycan-binding protein [Candidatus Omnitrophica bacterium]|nr:peptidoglycan-binding protein [Candidatus Omnitrophota bacterium]
MRSVTFLILLSGLLVAATGCVSKSQYQTEVSSLQGQVSQLDAALRAEQEKNQALQAQLGARLESAIPKIPFTGATYRTPSGFELPAVDIQKALKAAGYYAGTADGKIGPSSREAIRNFQRDHGLTADGVCGQQTWSKLKTYL